MKKFFALVLAVAMVLSMSTAFASLGWAQSSTAPAVAKANVSITVKALEYSSTVQDYTKFGLETANVWKLITGRVVKDTLVQFPITVTVPSQKQSGLLEEDYKNGGITFTLKNASLWAVMEKTAPNTYVECTSDWTPLGGGTYYAAAAQADLLDGGNYAFTVLAIVDSTAEVNCTAAFSMGQTVSSTSYSVVKFVKGGDVYTLAWEPGVALHVRNMTTNAKIQFELDATNKFTSSIWFETPYMNSALVPVHYCLNGELAFDGCCSCNKFEWNSQLMGQAWYEQVKAEFNEIMNALGFSFGYGSFNTAYCTKAGILALTAQTKATGSVKIDACTELGVTAATPSVSIPQTGAVSVIGYALVALAGAALAISKKN